MIVQKIKNVGVMRETKVFRIPYREELEIFWAQQGKVVGVGETMSEAINKCLNTWAFKSDNK